MFYYGFSSLRKHCPSSRNISVYNTFDVLWYEKGRNRRGGAEVYRPTFQVEKYISVQEHLFYFLFCARCVRLIFTYGNGLASLLFKRVQHTLLQKPLRWTLTHFLPHPCSYRKSSCYCTISNSYLFRVARRVTWHSYILPSNTKRAVIAQLMRMSPPSSAAYLLWCVFWFLMQMCSW